MIGSDIEIAQAATLKPIIQMAQDRLGIPAEALEPYGHYKAKIDLQWLNNNQTPNGKLVLVTAISPTPAGEGKTTTTVGLGDALNRIGKRTVIALREPSLGPVFGMKGGAAEAFVQLRAKCLQLVFVASNADDCHAMLSEGLRHD